MENFKSSINILKLIFKWKIHFIIIVLLSIICAVIFSGSIFITPLFKSNAVVYPANLTSYSEESETEQMLQFFQSRSIMDSVIQKFDLVEHYKINKHDKYFYTHVINEYNKNVKISKTLFEAVSIVVLDKNPEIACKMANAIIKFFNNKVLREHRKKYMETYLMSTDKLYRKQTEIDSTEGFLSELRNNYGIVDYPNQSREVAKGFLRTIDGDNVMQINTKEVLKLKKNIEEKGGEWVKYNDRFYDLIEEYGQYKMANDQAYIDINKELTYYTMITTPYPADKKAYPIRWLIVVITAIATFFLSLIVIMIIENYQVYRNSK